MIVLFAECLHLYFVYIIVVVQYSNNVKKNVQYNATGRKCRNSRNTDTNPHQSVPSVTSQPVTSSQTGNSVEIYRII